MSFNDLPFFSVGAGDGTNGKDGVSPTITIEDIVGGHKLIIVDAIGKKTVDILDGATGQTGAQGPVGPSGSQGIQGERGMQGEQGIQGEKGEPGKDGTDGKNGKDGTSVTHSWDGTVLTITSATGTSSADLKGSQGEPGSAGKDGENGKDGKSAFEYAQNKGFSGDETEFAEVLANAVSKQSIRLGLHTDGLLYLFINDEPVGTGVELTGNLEVTE
jgi:hypothetical protein